MKKSAIKKGKETNNARLKGWLSVALCAFSIFALFAKRFLYDNREANLFICMIISICLILGFIPSINSKKKISSLSSLISSFCLGLMLALVGDFDNSLYVVMSVIVCVLASRLINNSLGRLFDLKDSIKFFFIACIVTLLLLIAMRVSFDTQQDIINVVFSVMSLGAIGFLASLPGLTIKTE